jgi:hypothetical protein
MVDKSQNWDANSHNVYKYNQKAAKMWVIRKPNNYYRLLLGTRSEGSRTFGTCPQKLTQKIKLLKGRLKNGKNT